jgi:hypothetical protein
MRQHGHGLTGVVVVDRVGGGLRYEDLGRAMDHSVDVGVIALGGVDDRGINDVTLR